MLMEGFLKPTGLPVFDSQSPVDHRKPGVMTGLEPRQVALTHSLALAATNRSERVIHLWLRALASGSPTISQPSAYASIPTHEHTSFRSP